MYADKQIKKRDSSQSLLNNKAKISGKKNTRREQNTGSDFLFNEMRANYQSDKFVLPNVKEYTPKKINHAKTESMECDVVQRIPMEHICTHETILYKYLSTDLENNDKLRAVMSCCVSDILIYDTDNMKILKHKHKSYNKHKEEIETVEVNECYQVIKINGEDTKNLNLFIKDNSLYLDKEQEWKESFGSMSERETARNDIGVTKEQQSLLRKFELMRFQLQATYSSNDVERLHRQTSPLSKEGYARGIRTGLYEEYVDTMNKLLKTPNTEKVEEVAKNQVIDLGFSEISSADKKYNIYYIITGDLDKYISSDSIVETQNEIKEKVKSNDIIYFKQSKYKILFLKLGSNASIIVKKTLKNLELEETIKLNDSMVIKWVANYTKKIYEERTLKYKQNINKYKTFALRDLSCFSNPSEIKTIADENDLFDILTDDKLPLPKYIFLTSKFLFYMDKNSNIKAINNESYSIEKLDSYFGSAGMRLSPSQSAEQLVHLPLNLGKMKKYIPENKECKIIAPIGIDSHVQSTWENFKKLYNTLFKLLKYEQSPVFAVKQNVSAVLNITGRKMIELSNLIHIDHLNRADIPSSICAEFTDLLLDVCDISSTLYILHEGLKSKPDKTDERYIKFSRQMELHYEKCQNIHHILRFLLNWNQTKQKATVEQSINSVVGSDKSLQHVYSAAHGLAAMDKVRESLSPMITEKESVAVFEGSYYETPDIFAGHSTAKSVEEASLREKSVIVFEPHPNNAAMEEISKNDPCKLLDTLFPESSKVDWPSKITVIIDITLNSLEDEEIKQVIDKAQCYIKEGRLNLILLQSGTKFYQNGMDIVGIGTAMSFNNGENWVDFNKKMKDAPNLVSSDDNAYIGEMLDKNKSNLKSYLDQIKGNTSYLRNKLKESFNAGTDFYKLCKNEDSSTVYIAIIPALSGLASGESASDLQLAYNKIQEQAIKKKYQDSLSGVNQNAYFKYLLKAFNKTSVIDRSSFGFNITNLGECIKTVRITLGIEPEYMLDYYAQIISDCSKDIYNKIKEESW